MPPTSPAPGDPSRFRCNEAVIPARFRQKWLASQLHGGLLDRFLERKMLEGMQRVVVDEDADRSLGWQQVRQSIEIANERVIRSADIFPHRELTIAIQPGWSGLRASHEDPRAHLVPSSTMCEWTRS